jgi:hypothetical protein
MKLTELEQPIDEVAMNPKSFADAINQAQNDQVLVGFEFEVHSPVKKTRREVSLSELLEHRFIKTKLRSRPLDNWYSREYDVMFKYKPDQTLTFNKFAASMVKLRKERIQDAMQRIVDLNIGVTNEKIGNLYRKHLREYKKHYTEYPELGALKEVGVEIRRIVGRAETSEIQELYDVIDESNAEWPTAAMTLVYSMVDNFDYEDSFIDYLWKIKNADALYDKVKKDIEKYYDVDSDMLRAFVGIESDYDPYEIVSSRLKPIIEVSFGKTHIFRRYHEKKKNATDWYIEPDGSLEPDNSEDGSCEIVSPPLKPQEAIDALKKFYSIARAEKLYTNETTGLHINVSIPEKIDTLKLALFLGDKHVLKTFGREDNDYAQSVLDQLHRHVKIDIKSPKLNKTNINKIKRIADNISSAHAVSINRENNKYISFRHAGGDYLKNPEDVINVVGRFVRAVLIASNPKAERSEYIKKLEKLVSANVKRKEDPREYRMRMLRLNRQLKLAGKPIIRNNVPGTLRVVPFQNYRDYVDSQKDAGSLLFRILQNRDEPPPVGKYQVMTDWAVIVPYSLEPSKTSKQRAIKKFIEFADSKNIPNHSLNNTDAQYIPTARM